MRECDEDRKKKKKEKGRVWY